jgi:hypothetical protein
MPVFNLTYTVTMPRGTKEPEKFRTKIEAANEAEAKVKLHRFVQEKVLTSFLACEPEKVEPKPSDNPGGVFADFFEALDIAQRSERLRKKYGLDEKGKPGN